jgi:ADP-ribose pyrophosphatase YjhB (NUDIX family)
MYKVFIENRVVIFSTDVDNPCLKLSSKANVFEREILPYVLEFKEGETLFVRIPNLKSIERIFYLHDRITAAGGVVRRKKKILFIKRNGVWDLPKGKVEQNETIEDAAVREVEEECGLNNVILNSHLMNTLHTYRFKDKWVLKETHWYSMVYKDKKKTMPQEEEGITKVKWFRIGDDRKIRKNTYPSIIEVLEKYYSSF